MDVVRHARPCRFQSTLSMRRATRISLQTNDWPMISIHALHEESDWEDEQHQKRTSVISIHALHEESDVQTAVTLLPQAVFQSTLSMRRATR